MEMRLKQIDKIITVQVYVNEILDKVLDIHADRELRDQYLSAISKTIYYSFTHPLYEEISDYIVAINCCTGNYPRLFNWIDKSSVEFDNYNCFQQGLLNLSGYQMIPSVSSTINKFLKRHGYDCCCVHINTQIDYSNLTCNLEYFENTEAEMKKYNLVTDGVIIKKTIKLKKIND